MPYLSEQGMQALGLKLFAPSSPAAALTAVTAPAGTDSNVICKRFRDQFGQPDTIRLEDCRLVGALPVVYSIH